MRKVIREAMGKNKGKLLLISKSNVSLSERYTHVLYRPIKGLRAAVATLSLAVVSSQSGTRLPCKIGLSLVEKVSNHNRSLHIIQQCDWAQASLRSKVRVGGWLMSSRGAVDFAALEDAPKARTPLCTTTSTHTYFRPVLEGE